MGWHHKRGCGGHGRGRFPGAVLAMGWGGGPRGGFGGGWGDWGADFGGRGGGGRGRRRMFESGELRHVLLKLIADQPRHGYDLIRAIEELTHGAYAPSPGVVYPTLTMLEDMGLIEEVKAEGSRKAFTATAEGRAHLEERADEVEALLARLSDAGAERKKTGKAPIRRAMGNIASVLFHRLAREDVDDDTLHEIAAIIDEAASKIERLK